jgi:integrase
VSVQPVTNTPSGGSLPPRALGDLVVSHLAELDTMAPVSLMRVADLIRGFANYLAASGVGSAGDISEASASAFVRSLTRSKTEPSLATMHLRRTALRTFFREAKALGALSVDPTTSITLPPRSYGDLRPLIDEEIERCRSFAQRMEGETRYAVAWALAEATARVAELGAVRARDFDLKRGRAGSVDLRMQRQDGASSPTGVSTSCAASRCRSRCRPRTALCSRQERHRVRRSMS